LDAEKDARRKGPELIVRRTYDPSAEGGRGLFRKLVETAGPPDLASPRGVRRFSARIGYKGGGQGSR